jgi:hypothetical protein
MSRSPGSREPASGTRASGAKADVSGASQSLERKRRPDHRAPGPPMGSRQGAAAQEMATAMMAVPQAAGTAHQVEGVEGKFRFSPT